MPAWFAADAAWWIDSNGPGTAAQTAGTESHTMPEDLVEQKKWLQLQFSANAIAAAQIEAEESTTTPVLSPLSAWNRRGTQASGLDELLKHAEQSRNARSAILSGMKTGRFAKSVWRENRHAMDAPEWFGIPESNPLEKELPEMFGMSVLPNGGVTGIPDSFRLPKKIEEQKLRLPPTAACRSTNAVLTFPRSDTARTSLVPHRSKESVLPFRSPAVKQPILIFSLVGGVGGTSLAAGLTRILASCGERVMLADAGGHSLLPHYFGGLGSRQGVVRKFIAPTVPNSEAVSMLSLDVESFAWNDEEMDRILVEFGRESAAFDRVVWDLGNAPVEWTARVLRQGARVIVPLLPTAKCLMQLTATEAALQKAKKLGEMTNWQYILNQFDEGDRAHINIRGRFRAQLGERLLPFMLRSSPLVNEALLCGKTVVDHAPACPLVNDMWRLARSVAGLPQAYPEIVPGAWGEG
jgi:cellulose biosynthesis protein BcsQ